MASDVEQITDCPESVFSSVSFHQLRFVDYRKPDFPHEVYTSRSIQLDSGGFMVINLYFPLGFIM